MKLSAYTIAKNCTDANDCKVGLAELNVYFDKTKTPKTSMYIRLYKLSEKLKEYGNQ